MKDPFLARLATALRSHRRRALRAGRGTEVDYGLTDLARLATPYRGGPCPCCGARLTDAALSIDHAVPVSRGGSFGFDNLAVLCLTCNQRKGQLTAEEYAGLVALAGGWPPEAAADLYRRLRAGGGHWRRRAGK